MSKKNQTVNLLYLYKKSPGDNKWHGLDEPEYSVLN